MKHMERSYYCDFCGKKLGYNDYPDVKIPVLYGPDMASPSNTGFESVDAFAEAEEAKWQSTVGFHQYDLCENCVKKTANILILNVPKFHLRYGLQFYGAEENIPDKPFYQHDGAYCSEGLYKAVFKDDDDISIKQRVITAFEESRTHTCESCSKRVGDNGNKICIETGRSAADSFDFLKNEDRYCEKWKFRSCMGHLDDDKQDASAAGEDEYDEDELDES